MVYSREHGFLFIHIQFSITYGALVVPAKFLIDPVPTYVALETGFGLLHYGAAGVALTYLFRKSGAQRSAPFAILFSMKRLLAALVLVASIALADDVGQSPLIFREDWTATPPSLPLTQRDVVNPQVAVALHGPGAGLIKKSFHDAREWDAHYIWSGLTQGTWAVTLSLKSGTLMDLSTQATVRWRSQQSGFRELRLVVGLADGSWLVSDESDTATTNWRVHEFSLTDMHWRQLNIDTVTESRWAKSVDLSRVRAIGFTDLMAGGRSTACSRLDWIEVYGQRVVEGPTELFILSGQSNMVGWGNSLELGSVARFGHDNRLVMYEGGEWQNLKPFKEPAKNQREGWSITERTFGPEIGFAHALAEAWPDKKIGIVKQAVGGTGIMAWAPEWNKADADLTNDAAKGSIYKELIEKVRAAKKSGNVAIRGFVWLQGGKDMISLKTANRYADNLKALVAAVRRDVGVPDLPVLIGTYRQGDIPDSFDGVDITTFKYESDKPRPGALTVMKAQTDAPNYIANSKVVILRDLPTHPNNIHANTEGMRKAGQAYAATYLESFSAKK